MAKQMTVQLADADKSRGDAVTAAVQAGYRIGYKSAMVNADLVAMLRYGADAVEAASALLINDTDERLRFGTDRIPWTSAELRCEADRLEANP